MPRPPKGWWDERSRRYYARLGPPSPKTGKPTPVMLTREDGSPLAYGDQAGVAAAVRRLLAERDARAVRAAGPTVFELCRDFVAWHKANGTAPRTWGGYDESLRRFAGFTHGGSRYADRPAAEVGPADLWRLKASGASGLRNLYAAVKACWAWAARPVEGREPVRVLPESPFRGLKLPRPGRGPGGPEKIVAWRETRRLVRFARAWARRRPRFRREKTVAGRRLKALCLDFIALTGCRPFEAWQLRWAEFRADQGVAVIDPGRTKPRGRDRRIPLPDRLIRRLALVRGSPAAHPVFVFLPASSRCRGVPSMKEYHDWLGEVRAAAESEGVPLPAGFTSYWLRHTWQTTGLDVESAEGVAQAAGNSPKVLLDTYQHLRNRRVREVGDKVARQRRKKPD
jgi:integrase